MAVQNDWVTFSYRAYGKWHATLSLAASLARELRGPDASGWAKSQTAAQQTGLGTDVVPSRDP
ncbi:MAG TPA: hypothetical protein VF844_06625 [Ktedonobacteraceae bacterium]